MKKLILNKATDLFLNFGFKSVTMDQIANEIGMFLALSWKVGLASLGIFLIVLTKTKFVSLSSISAAILLPIFMFFYLGKFMHSYFFISLIVALLVIWKHRTNITRLLKGEESKINQN